MTEAEVSQWLQLFVAPEQITELRALRYDTGKGPSTQAGFFDSDHLRDMAAHALRLTDNADGVYFVPNPINPMLLDRCKNRVQTSGGKQLTADEDVMKRRWFIVDVDPQRPTNTSATNDEKILAHEMILEAKKIVVASGITPRIVLADSGNGYHLVCEVDLPAIDGAAVRSLLNAIGNELDTPAVKIDRKVFNPARIIKLYGTAARKGKSTKERPHRRTSVMEVFEL